MIYKFISYSSESNCYLLIDKKVALVDSGIHSEKIAKKLRELSLDLDYLILSHCHFDHIAGSLKLIEEFSPVVIAHENDSEAIETGNSKTLAYLFHGSFPGVRVDKKLRGDERLKLGKYELEFIHTPGHTPGSICVYEKNKKVLFSGDTIFKDSIGRTDFPSGNFIELRYSIEKLLKIREEKGVAKLYPGHGETGNGADIEKVYKSFFL
ncbi:MAG TPA: MBL fold metallo-hydrolase [Candidatus Altiarchaeales archaeon]|nr:MBL fold metallo-hydrolase [Candidatus Altiarchaeales archaeon]